MNSSSAASSAVLAGATGIQAVAGQIVSNPTAAANLITASSNLEASMQNLQNVVDNITSLADRSSTLASVAGEQAQFMWSGTYRSFTSGILKDNYNLSIGLSNVLDPAKILGKILGGDNGGWQFLYTGHNFTNYLGGQTSLFNLANNLNTVINGGNLVTGTSDITANNGNNRIINTTTDTTKLAGAIQAVKTQMDNISLNMGNFANNQAITSALNRQQAAYASLQDTLTQLQQAVLTNSNNMAKLNPNALNALKFSADRNVNNLSDAFNDATTARTNGITPEIQASIKATVTKANNQDVVPLLVNTMAAQSSAKTIDGIINGNDKGEAVQVTITPSYAKVSNTNTDVSTPLADKPATSSSDFTSVSFTQKQDTLKDSNGKVVNSLKKAIADVKAANKNLDDTVLAVAINNNQAVGAAAAQDANARKSKAPTILPTAKAGIVAFFGKHQSVSVEYQYYFRNTNPNFTSGEVTLNYAYYFGGK
ncbi:hypothetical protein [Helicobacter sp. 11S02629-2]|uniref:hypothetical protein n=1 Tax=Helicobacter sp. 11S02629-2 TaxID=1476195 RepID=UPI000BA52E3B|nr:hypothetical protein [Helicobacter sp. 11S02629-2]PAF42424.1 hypothetical protein BKH40_07910 [Helicobacter sp. 11S02629-2]